MLPLHPYLRTRHKQFRCLYPFATGSLTDIRTTYGVTFWVHMRGPPHTNYTTPCSAVQPPHRDATGANNRRLRALLAPLDHPRREKHELEQIATVAQSGESAILLGVTPHRREQPLPHR